MSGVPRAPVITSQWDTVSGSEGTHLLSWSTMTLYPVVEYVLLHRRGWPSSHSDDWDRVVLPELCLPRHNTVYASYRQVKWFFRFKSD